MIKCVSLMPNVCRQYRAEVLCDPVYVTLIRKLLLWPMFYAEILFVSLDRWSPQLWAVPDYILLRHCHCGDGWIRWHRTRYNDGSELVFSCAVLSWNSHASDI